MTAIHISREQAQRFLATYHFTPTDLPGVFTRLGTVQYDPLNPVGRNPDLVLQARVPGYRVNDWQHAAYTDRLIYDAWDKQACLVPSSDWPFRAATRELYRPYHDSEILQTDAELAAQVLAAIDAQGPLSSLEFEDKAHYGLPGSWVGSTRINRILRAMWVGGVLVTHHRKSGRHYYDRPERVVPPQHYNAPLVTDLHDYHRWIMARRFQSVGLLRSTGEACIWSACGTGAERKHAIHRLVEEGTLTPVHVGEKKWPYYMPSNALPLLDAPLPSPRVLFLGPLDSILWDRKAIVQLFDFDYTWEVYKPVEQRRWGYYVLPIFYKDRFIGRLDSRLDGSTWNIAQWWWEADVTLDDELCAALSVAMREFMRYMGASSVKVGERVESEIIHTLARTYA